MQFYLLWLVGNLLLGGFLQGVKCSLSGKVSPISAGSHIPVLLSFPRGSCSRLTSRGVQWVCTLCIYLSPPRAIPGLGGSVSSLLLGGTVPQWRCPALLTPTTLCWDGFFLGADCSGAAECEMWGGRGSARCSQGERDETEPERAERREGTE